MPSTLNHKSNSVNMSDIARAAQVSHPTVSIVLNGRHTSARISEETRARVLQVARELGYRRNALAHAVKTGRSYTLGFLTTAPDTEYSMLILSGILSEAEGQGYTVKRFHLSNTEKDSEVIGRCSEERPDGVIVNDYGRGACLDELRQEFETHNIPHVWLNSKERVPGIHIYPHDEEGIYQAVQHLIALGHQRIAFIGGKEHLGTGIHRVAGFRRAIREARLDDSFVRWTNWDGQVAENSAEEMVAKERVTAFITGSDALALLIMLKFHRMGLRLPDEVSVIGCGDMVRVNNSYPPLTTVAVPYKELGRASVNKLLALLTDPESATEAEEIAFATPLVIRESTAGAKG
ncbi:HTH-type transcriptional regulator AscG [Abditibacteriota bacterium]|nr:HTH-type transcriptional regulator AscG [Abditibacteriota bacterium]